MSHSFKLMRDQIAELALRRVGVSPKSNTSMWHEKLQDAIQALHLLVRELQDKRSIHLWTIEEISLKIPRASYVFVSGSPWTNYVCTKSHVSASHTIPGGSGPWDAHWSVVSQVPSGVTPVAWAAGTRYVDGNTVDFPDPYLDADTVNVVYQGKDYDVELIEARRFSAMLDRNHTGMPKFAWIERVHNNDTVAARMHVSPMQDQDYSYTIRAVRYLRDMENAHDTPDVPQSMISALSYLLTAELGDQYGLPLEERQYFTMKAEAKFAEAKKGYVETTTYDRVRPCY